MLFAPTPDLEDGVEEADVDVAAEMGRLVEVAPCLFTALQTAFVAVGAEPTTEPIFATTA